MTSLPTIWLSGLHPRTGLFSNPGTQSHEVGIQAADGLRHDVIFHKATFFSPDGRLAGIIGSVLDITKLRRAEEERRGAETQLRQAQKMEALGTLAGGIAHDFNNILGIIFGYTELARESIPDSRAQEQLDEVLKAANRAKDLVQHRHHQCPYRVRREWNLQVQRELSKDIVLSMNYAGNSTTRLPYGNPWPNAYDAEGYYPGVKGIPSSVPVPNYGAVTQ